MIKIMIGLSLVVLTGCSSVASTPETSLPEIIPETIPEPFCQVFDDFSGAQNVRWQRVNDNVMGGRSLGDFEFEDGSMVLRGAINLNGGGFTSVRADLPGQVLEPFDQVVVTAKGDGRGYQLTFQDQNRRRISHRLALNLPANAEWEERTINFADLEPAFFGRKVSASGFNKDEAREIGIILNDGLGGEYELGVKEIKFCKSN